MPDVGGYAIIIAVAIIAFIWFLEYKKNKKSIA